MDDLHGRVAVVTGGASGIGKAICRALLGEGTSVVIADIEEPALAETVAELTPFGKVTGIETDVMDAASVDSMAQQVFSTFGACHLLFNNAGVGVSSSIPMWRTTPNDWKWCFGVNVFGVVHGILSFVPRMIETNEEGVVVNTSSGDGGFAPMPHASVYAPTKAGVSALTECLAHQLVEHGTNLRAAVFYPSGGLLATNLFTSYRNRPAGYAREIPFDVRPPSFEEYRAAREAAGEVLSLQDLDELAQLVIAGVKDGRFIIGYGVPEMAELLKVRADAIGRCELPPDIFALRRHGTA